MVRGRLATAVLAMFVSVWGVAPNRRIRGTGPRMTTGDGHRPEAIAVLVIKQNHFMYLRSGSVPALSTAAVTTSVGTWTTAGTLSPASTFFTLATASIPSR